ncbi:nicotinate-nucleotide--dimethylbenzimidazole phosphoribosyltransferase [Clostridium vincentii]|uniref:nicotinate-nucleotide--dimethylbenzimidazole phosphoribosyltransferase n=1 Tax=Clostridium vincentii TaxID=52704 RepID=UPI000D03FA22|nr:nicotinate-nucleotide--dimethylbenzimidazole phosphoribosyltransferase [Clostridium vincentii]
MESLENALKKITPSNKTIMKECIERWDGIAKPLRSLGTLEEAVVKIAGITENINVNIDKKALIIMCADNGVVKENITQTGSEVTAIVAENFTKRKATVSIMAGVSKTDVFTVDIGIERDMENSLDINEEVLPFRILNRKISYGTRNLYLEPAMTQEQTIAAIEVGINLVKELKKKNYNIIATGEMGIGNTTTSSAITSVLLNEPVELVTGKGAGLSSSGLERKIHVIKESIKLNKPKVEDPIDVLSKVGGLDIAGLVGVFIGGATFKIPIVIDGFISAVAALIAIRLEPLVIGYILPSHVSKEPAGEMVLNKLGLTPFINCGMFLGEGTGAIAVFPILEMACNVYRDMSTFSEIHVEEYKQL